MVGTIYQEQHEGACSRRSIQVAPVRPSATMTPTWWVTGRVCWWGRSWVRSRSSPASSATGCGTGSSGETRSSPPSPPPSLSPSGSSCSSGSSGRLVEVEPVPAEVLHGLGEPLEVGRLGDVGIGAEPVAGDDVLVLPGRGEEDDGQDLRPLVAAQALQDLKAVHLGQLHVEQDELRHDAGVPPDVGARSEEVLQRLLTVADDDDPVHLLDDAVRAEGAHGEEDLVLVVLDEQDGSIAHAVPHVSCWQRIILADGRISPDRKAASPARMPGAYPS